jgi:uncharacterized lipoprotein YddW (UPF0748 family)
MNFIMMRKLPSIVRLLCCVFLLYSFTSTKHIKQEKPYDSPPQVMQEFRAAWVATVLNIDWPSKPGLPTQTQKQEVITLLDFLQAHHFNAVVLQVRPQADAFYKSELEPWSYYLTGTQGKAPEPFYDPLEFWLKEAHDRGLELHVWVNPYRAHHRGGKEISDQSIVKKHPEMVMQLKSGYWWMNPAKKEVQDFTNGVVMDIVKRYDIDGLHMDDYFYPYPDYNGNADFPDSDSWATYLKSGGKLSRADWRRDAVNQLIERLYKNIKAQKSWVKFGISPFGIWQPGYPASIEGFDQYHKLYADARLWLNKGWVDYFTPQLYWPINRPAQSFPVLLGWWAGENKMNRHLWPGINLGIEGKDKNPDETTDQILLDREMQPQSKGVVHWSLSTLIKNTKLADTILKSVYKKQALVPPSPWLDNKAPAAPVVTTAMQSDVCKINWTHKDEKDVFHWIVYYEYGNKWDYQIMNRNDRSLLLNKKTNTGTSTQPLKNIIVSAVDRMGNESDKKEVDVK